MLRAMLAVVAAIGLVLPWLATTASAQFSSEYEAPASSEKPKSIPKPQTAKPAAAADTALSIELLKAAGVDQQLAPLPTMVQVAFESETKGKLNNAGIDTAPFLKLLSTTYDSGKIFAGLAAHVAKTLPARDHKFVLEYLRGPSGLRVRDAVVAMSAPEGFAALKSFAETVSKSPGSLAPKIELYKALDKSTGGSEMLALLVTEATFSMPKSLTTSGVTNKQKAKEMAVAYDSVLKQQRVQALNTSLLTLAYLNQTVSDADMQEWLKMAESPAGVRFYSSLNKAFLVAMNNAGTTLSQGIVRILNEQQAAKNKATKAN